MEPTKFAFRRWWSTPLAHPLTFGEPGSLGKGNTAPTRCVRQDRWFQIVFIFTPTWGNDPIWFIFFNWVETTSYCWWLKSCTTCDVWNRLVNNGKNYLATGAGFQPSTVVKILVTSTQFFFVAVCLFPPQGDGGDMPFSDLLKPRVGKAQLFEVRGMKRWWLNGDGLNFFGGGDTVKPGFFGGCTKFFVSKCMVYVKKLSCCSCCTPKLGSNDPICLFFRWVGIIN